jgi:hypothetical protein
MERSVMRVLLRGGAARATSPRLRRLRGEVERVARAALHLGYRSYPLALIFVAHPNPLE